MGWICLGSEGNATEKDRTCAIMGGPRSCYPEIAAESGWRFMLDSRCAVCSLRSPHLLLCFKLMPALPGTCVGRPAPPVRMYSPNPSARRDGYAPHFFRNETRLRPIQPASGWSLFCRSSCDAYSSADWLKRMAGRSGLGSRPALGQYNPTITPPQ